MRDIERREGEEERGKEGKGERKVYHCICFSRTCLAVREDANVVSITDACDQWLGILENRLCKLYINYQYK